MALTKNQDKIGTQRKTSSGPDGTKTGRDSFTKKNQPTVGTKHGVSVNQEHGKSTRPVPKKTHASVGVKKAASGDGAGSPKSIPDGVGSAFPTV